MAEPGGPYTLTHQDLSRIVGVSVTTIKSYRRKFPEFFFPPSLTKPLRFRPETEKLCLRIADLFSMGWTIKRIRQELSNKFPIASGIDKLPIASSVAPSGTSAEGQERVLLMLGQMNKGLGAMATAQARFGMESQKEKTRLDALIGQQAALAERLDALAQTLEQLLPALIQDARAGTGSRNPSDHSALADQAGSSAPDDSSLSHSDPTGHPAGDSSGPPAETSGSGRSDTQDPGISSSSPGQQTAQAPSSPTRRVIHVQGRSGTQAYEFDGASPNPVSAPDFPGSSTNNAESDPSHPASFRNDSEDAHSSGLQVSLDPPPSQTQHIELKPDFLHLPVVLRSSRGEYLGLTGKSGHPFSLAEFEIYLSQRPDLKPMRESWKGAGSQWTLNLGSPDSSTGWHAFHLAKTQTPKGNQVALLSQLDLDGKAVTDAFLQAFFRQIREALLT